VRGIEDALPGRETGRLLLSRTEVSEIGKQLWEDYQAFKSRDLAEYDIAYLFIDGIAERIRPGQRREPVLAACRFTFDGRKVLLHPHGRLEGGRRDGLLRSSRTSGGAASAIRSWC
jgi:putative transposase